MTDIPFRKILGLNQQSYQYLKVALSLNLRRQVFIAVCDDLRLRDRLSTQLQAELTKSNLPNLEAAADADAPRIVTLQLNLNDPNPIVQIAQWLAQASPPPGGWQSGTMPAFQILGIEKLTRQPASAQRLFFTHLQSLEYNLPLLESSVVFWVTQPWFRVLPHSAPEFWRCRTGVFEFIGDPTPLFVTVPERIGVTTQIQEKTAFSEATATSAVQIISNPWDLLAQDLDSAYLFESDPEVAPQDPHSTTQEHSITQEHSTTQEHSEAIAESDPVPTSLPLGLQAESLNQLPLIQQIELLHQEQAPPQALAGAYCHLGNLYRDRVEQGDATPQNMAIAIQAYEQVLHYLPETSSLWVDILNDLGNLYWMLSRVMPSSQEGLPYLQRGLQAYQLALTKINPQNQLQTYPMVQNNLGAAYADLARHQDPADSLLRSVDAYLQALRYRSPEIDPLRYASTQNNLGTTYWNLAQHQHPEANLKQAIAAYSEALRFYKPAQEPLNYAMIQNNLGTAYWNLAQHERPRDWLALAIAAYRTAIKYRTLKATPAAFAATQNNLGTAYWHMANHAENIETRLGYLKEAIGSYEFALQAAAALMESQPNQPLNFDQIATQNNLGLAYYQIATDTQTNLNKEEQSSHLKAALGHHLKALQDWTQQPELRSAALSRVVETIRAFYNQLGLTGQNLALSLIPSQLLPEILPRL